MGHLKQIILLSLVLAGLCDQLKAQDAKLNFIGINPGLTIEPFYEKGEMDIAIIPIVYQRPFAKRFDIRLASICNLGLRKNGNDISHVGLEIAMPVFFKQKETKKESSKGFFAAPVLSLTRNRIEKHNNLGLWVEPGYNLLFDDGFAMSFGLQVGATYFSYDNAPAKWGNHFGVKVIFGKWF